MSTYDIQSHTIHKVWRNCTKCSQEFYSRKQTVCEDCRKAEARRKMRAKKKAHLLVELATFLHDPKSR